MADYNPFSLEGKTILITGAAGGIGRATAIECAKLGAYLILTDMNEEGLKATHYANQCHGSDVPDAEASEEEEVFKELLNRLYRVYRWSLYDSSW